MKPYPFEQEARHFSSGVNSPGEVRGISGWIGIAADEIRTGLLEELEARAGGPTCLFVDSGAFSEVEFTAAGPEVVDEITHADWILRCGRDPRARRGERSKASGAASVGDRRGREEVVAFSITPEAGQGSKLRACRVDTAPSLTATDLAEQTDRGVRLVLPAVEAGGAPRARRLTPRECERLQGFPDDYTAIPDGSDTARFRALGNTMPVPIMRWIGERIQAFEAGDLEC